jgi:hypothetical protein
VIFKFTKQLSETLENKENLRKNSEKKKEILKVVKVKKLRFRIISILFEGYKYPLLSPGSVYFPLFSMMRYVGIAITLAVLNSKPKYIPYGCCMVECIFYLYAINNQVKQSTMENRIEHFNSFIHIVYNLLAALAYTHISTDYNRQLDLAMISIVSIKIAVNLLIVAYALLATLFEAIADSCLKKKTEEKAKEDPSQKYRDTHNDNKAAGGSASKNGIEIAEEGKIQEEANNGEELEFTKTIMLPPVKGSIF